MPSKYIIRDFTEGGVYHIHNKSLPGTDLFKDDNDYNIFLYYLTVYTKPLEKVLEKYPNVPFRLRYNNISQEIDILAYTLLPNRFHLITRLHTREGASKLLKQLTNAYTYYFNRRHTRMGPLMQGRFKACSIDVEKELTHLVRFLDREPQATEITENFAKYPYSSYQEYSQETDDPLTKQRLIHSFLTTPQNYREHIANDEDYHKSLPHIQHITMHNS